MSAAAALDERAEGLRLIRDSVAAIAPPRGQGGGDLTRVRRLRFADPGFDRAVWKQMGALGWLGLLVAEADGGSGLGAAELCAVAEGLGAGLVPEPFVPCAVIAGLLPEDWRARAIAGEAVVLPAWQERANGFAPPPLVGGGWGEGLLRHDLDQPPPPPDRLPPGEGEVVVSGRRVFIPMASGADAFLVATPSGLALVDRAAAGLTLSTEPTQDGGHFGTLTLDTTPGTPLPGAIPLDAVALGTAAYLLGVMEQAFALTLDYLRTRAQFGRPIGSFQALQHRCADLRIQIALTRASVQAAAASLDAQGPTPQTQAAVSRAKARAAEASMLVTRQAIQLHGGIGYTDEADIGLYLRKAMVLANLYGSAAVHRARYAALAPEGDE